MSVVHKMIGYNKRTKKLELEFDLPGDDLEKVREITALPMDYEELLGAFPLPAAAAHRMAAAFDLSPNIDRYDWFIEPFACEDLAR